MTSQTLFAAARQFNTPAHNDAANADVHYSARARFAEANTCWVSVVIGLTEQDVRDRLPAAVAALPGATWEFGRQVRDEDDRTVWRETLLPI